MADKERQLLIKKGDDAKKNGELQKMLILGFTDPHEAEAGTLKDADFFFEALINPETYTTNHTIKFSKDDQGQGTSGKQLKYVLTEPEEMTFDFLFDGTGIIDGEWRTTKDNPAIVDNLPQDSIADSIQKFKHVLIDYNGDSHQPRHVKLIWGGNAIFKGRASAISITYKLFKPDGTPIRATAKVTISSSIHEPIRAAKDGTKSADLTHVRKVIAGDTLPLLCYRIYGDPKYYMQVAKFNGLGNFRSLTPGTDLVFPPIAKTANSS